MRVQDVERIAREVTGAPVALVNTGGGCGAVEVRLEGGAYLLITDEDVLDYWSGEAQTFTGGAFVGMYDDTHAGELGNGPLRYLDADYTVDEPTLRALLRRVLAGEGQQ